MHKPARTSSVTRRLKEETAEPRHDRTEVRKDIRKTWWPDE
jgi:hypothetical protein